MIDLYPLLAEYTDAFNDFYALLATGNFNAASYDAAAARVQQALETLNFSARMNSVEAFKGAGEFRPNYKTAE